MDSLFGHKRSKRLHAGTVYSSHIMFNFQTYAVDAIFGKRHGQTIEIVALHYLSLF